MDLRKKCKNINYGNLVVQVVKMNNPCRFCVKRPQNCKYNGDFKNTRKSDFEYCFDNVRAWVSDHGFKDYYELELTE